MTAIYIQLLLNIFEPIIATESKVILNSELVWVTLNALSDIRSIPEYSRIIVCNFSYEDI